MNKKESFWNTIQSLVKQLSNNKRFTSVIFPGLLIFGAILLDEYAKDLFTLSSLLITAFLIFVFILTSYIVFDNLQDNLFKDEITKITGALEAAKMDWLLLETEAAEIEEKSDEIWVFLTSLSKELDVQSPVHEAVKKNIEDKKKYTFFLPDSIDVKEGELIDFHNLFGKSSAKFVLIPEEWFLIHSEIVLYNPDNQDNRQAIEWLPNMKAGKGKETEDGVERKNINYYIKLDPIRTNKMRSIGKNLIKKLDYYYESY
jgi:hypothetical protein